MSLLYSCHMRVCEGGCCSLSELPSILTVFLIFTLVNVLAYDIPPTININMSLLRTFPRTGSCNPCSLQCFPRVSQNPWETPIYSILYMVFNVCGQTVINVVWIVFQSHKREQQESSLVLIVMHPLFIFLTNLNGFLSSRMLN